jgi:hypothetical protein
MLGSLQTLRTVACACALLALPAAAQHALWTQRTTGATPTLLPYRMAYDAARGVCVAVGASAGVVETWEFDGAEWTQAFPANQPPPPPANHVMTYDTVRQRVLLVSQRSSGSDVWEWTGADWIVHTPATSPRADLGSAVAFDEQSGLLVLHGGARSSQVFAETWLWDGTDWNLVGTGGPVPRTNHALVYDAARQRPVLFGGRDVNNALLGDTWTFAGQWFEHFGIAGPAPRMARNAIYDRARDVAVVFGGATGSALLQDLWEWDGASWSQLVAINAPPPRYDAVAYDAARDVTVVLAPNGVAMETWELAVGPKVPGTVQPFGVACAGRWGAPQLTDTTGQAPVVGGPLSCAISTLPPNPLAQCFLWFGVSNSTWQGTPLPLDLGVIGMPGCGLQVSPDFAIPLAIAGDTATWAAQIPSEAALVGGAFHVQGIVLDFPYAPVGAVTNGLTITIGNS